MNSALSTRRPTIKHVLIVKMWALGDVLMATPILRVLKNSFPGCRITWFVEKTHASVLNGNPLIDEVIPFDSGPWRRDFRYGRFVAYAKKSMAMRRLLLEKQFDVVINLTAEKWWSVWFSVAPLRIGLFPRQRPGLIGRLYTTVIPRTREPLLHNSQHYLLTMSALGLEGPFDESLVYQVPEADRESSKAFLEEALGQARDAPIVVVHPGTSSAVEVLAGKPLCEIDRADLRVP